jgi:hypothetical protein
MFERFFRWALKHGPRLLFGAAVVILLAGLGRVVNVLASDSSTRSRTYAGRLWDGLANSWDNALPFLIGGLSSAALPFFCALLIQRIDLWMQGGGAAAAAAPPPAPSWLARQGGRLLFALALLFFLAAGLSFVDWALQVHTIKQAAFWQAAWLGPLWSGSLLLFASLALDRLDRWLATVRP